MRGSSVLIASVALLVHGFCRTADDLWILSPPEPNASFGEAVQAAGDVDGDGFGDFLIAAPLNADGRVYLYRGSAGGPASDPAWEYSGSEAGERLGGAVAALGDVNGDGYHDVAVAAPGARGRVLVFHGSANGLAASPQAELHAPLSFSSFGESLAGAGDINGDGYRDLVVGAPGFDGAFSDEGRVYVYFGSSSGFAPDESQGLTGPGLAGARFGSHIAGNGDFNADGYDDVAIGAEGLDRSFAFRGEAAGLTTHSDWDCEGYQVAIVGDVHGDSYSDLLVANGLGAGQAWLFSGGAGGLSPEATWTRVGESADAELGRAVHVAGDVNGDGYADFILGRSNDALIILGSPAGPSSEGMRIIEGVGGVGCAGDLDGDGFGDVALGGRVLSGRADLIGVVPTLTHEPEPEDYNNGGSLDATGDFNGDGYKDLLVATSKWSLIYQFGGKLDLYYGSPQGLASEPDKTYLGSRERAYYASLAFCPGDLNGDGYDELVVSSEKKTAHSDGAVYEIQVYFGGLEGPADSPAWVYETEPVVFSPGAKRAGDVNADGFADLVITVPSQDGHPGFLMVFQGRPAGLPPAPSTTITDVATGGSLGAGGDVNGDGIADVALRRASVDQVAVFAGSPRGLEPAPFTTLEVPGPGSSTVIGLLDANGDGASDLALSVLNYDNWRGLQAIHLAGPDGLNPNPWWTREGSETGYRLGSIATFADLNADGYDDFVSQGAIAVGDPPEFYLGGEHAPALTDHPFSSQGEGFGKAGDIDGDGFVDLAIMEVIDLDEWVFLYQGNAIASPTGGGVRRSHQRRVSSDAQVMAQGRVDRTGRTVLESFVSHPRGGLLPTSFCWRLAKQGEGLSAKAHQCGPKRPVSAPDFEDEEVDLETASFIAWDSQARTDDPFFPGNPWVGLPDVGKLETSLLSGGCRDDDGDGAGYLSDPDCPLPIADCAPDDAGVWDSPGEVRNLRFEDRTTIRWDPPELSGGASTVLTFDLLRSATLFQFGSECLLSATPALAAQDLEFPAPGRAFSYLARARNTCPRHLSWGPVGAGNSGLPRLAEACD